MNSLGRPQFFEVDRTRTVTAVLGPTNTGKTHFAIERLLAHGSGAIGLPLRLLAREVYGRVVARVGVGAVALVTGEEKIIPQGARYWVATVEAMPRDLDVAFVAIDEVQLCGDSAANAATSSPTGCSMCAAAREPCCSARPRRGRSSRSCCPALPS